MLARVLAGPDPGLPASLLSRDRLEVIADAAALPAMSEHPTQEVWLVRHAETEWSKSGRHTGRTDVPLTDAGRERARELGARLGGHEFALVLVSPLERARETARLAGLGDACQVREDLLEWDYGDYEGITTAEIREERPGLVPLARRRAERRDGRRGRRRAATA